MTALLMTTETAVGRGGLPLDVERDDLLGDLLLTKIHTVLSALRLIRPLHQTLGIVDLAPVATRLGELDPTTVFRMSLLAPRMELWSRQSTPS